MTKKQRPISQKIKNICECKIDFPEVLDFIKNSSLETKVYVGGDSQVYNHNGKKWILFITIIGVHVDGNKGVKVFKQADWLQDFSGSMRHRLMTEVYTLTEIAGRIIDNIGDREFNVHLDINSSDKHPSNVVVKEAVGYVKGVLGVDPQIKPDSFMASIGADRWTKV